MRIRIFVDPKTGEATGSWATTDSASVQIEGSEPREIEVEDTVVEQLKSGTKVITGIADDVLEVGDNPQVVAEQQKVDKRKQLVADLKAGKITTVAGLAKALGDILQ